MKLPLVSIIVPCYNQAQYLSEALDSVLLQTYQDWECIVVNDGSSDHTDKIAEEYRAKDSRIKYLIQENQGVSIARNNGIYHSSGEFILPLDADDKLAPTYIEKAVARFREYPRTKVVYSLVKCFGESNNLFDLPPYKYESMLWRGLIVCTAMYRRSDFDKTIGYNPNMRNGLEDWDFWLTLISKDDEVHRIEEELFYYRKKKESRTSNSMKYLRDLYIQMYRNHKCIYDNYSEDIIYKQYLLEHTEAIIKQRVYEKELEIRNSWSYRIGSWILFPFKQLPKLFKKK